MLKINIPGVVGTPLKTPFDCKLRPGGKVVPELGLKLNENEIPASGGNGSVASNWLRALPKSNEYVTPTVASGKGAPNPACARSAAVKTKRQKNVAMDFRSILPQI